MVLPQCGDTSRLEDANVDSKKFLGAGTHDGRGRSWMTSPGRDVGESEEMVDFTFTVSRIIDQNSGMKT